MSDFNVRSDSVDIEHIMRQIRARIREKRGVDYTEAEVQQLAKVKLETFLDPRGVRSDLVEQFRRREYTPSPPLPKLELKEFSIYGTHRGLLRSIRNLLQPILKLFVNPNPLIHFVWTQAQAQKDINEEIDRWMRKREALDAKMEPLHYELLHNLVVELTRNSIEVHNLKMRVESLSSRLDFDERRSRSLERVVEYRTPAPRPAAAPAPAGGPQPPPSGQPAQFGQPGQASQTPAEGGGGERRRRRRRRRRHPGQTMADHQQGRPMAPGAETAPGGAPPGSMSAAVAPDSQEWDEGDPGGDAGDGEASDQ